MAGNQSGLPLELSSAALEEGWLGIEKTPVQSIDSAELEGLLREGFYNGERFRQLVNEPLVYGGAALVIVAYLAFMMREEIEEEWRRLRRAIAEPEWVSDSGRDWPANRDGIVARIRSRITHWKGQTNVLLNRATISGRSRLKQFPNSESLIEIYQPASTEVQSEVSTARQLANPLPSHSPKPPSQGHTIFPGSSPPDAAHSQSKPWDESEWID